MLFAAVMLSTPVMLSSRLLMFLGSLYCKQCVSRSDCLPSCFKNKSRLLFKDKKIVGGGGGGGWVRIKRVKVNFKFRYADGNMFADN